MVSMQKIRNFHLPLTERDLESGIHYLAKCFHGCAMLHQISRKYKTDSLGSHAFSSTNGVPFFQGSFKPSL